MKMHKLAKRLSEGQMTNLQTLLGMRKSERQHILDTSISKNKIKRLVVMRYELTHNLDNIKIKQLAKYRDLLRNLLDTSCGNYGWFTIESLPGLKIINFCLGQSGSTLFDFIDQMPAALNPPRVKWTDNESENDGDIPTIKRR